MSEEKRRRILEQLSKGEISAQQAEEELGSLNQGRKGLFKSFCCGLKDMDLCLNFGGDCGRVILEEVLTGSLEPGPVELDLGTANGRIRVEVWDSPGYQLTIEKRVRAGSREQAEEIAGEYRFAEILGNKIQAGDGQYQEIHRRISVSLHLQLPRTTRIFGRIKTANGGITVTGLENQGLELRSANGSIQLEDISGGAIQVTTVNGGIKICGNTTQVEARTTNGSINLDTAALAGDARLGTVNGSINALIPASADTAISVLASTVCGRVVMEHGNLGLKKIGGFGGKHIETRSSNWDQAAQRFSLDMNTVNGSISVRESHAG